MKLIIEIEGMMCPHCEERVATTLKSIFNTEKVKVNHKKKEAVVKTNQDLQDELIKEKIKEIGYEVLTVNRK